MTTVVCAPNAFKGALSARDAAEAMGLGVADAGGVARCVPVADGGDGTLDVLLAATPGSWISHVAVRGPLGQPVDARLGWLRQGEAVVEMAEAAGLRLLAADALDPLRASTYGVGELIRAALDGGAARIVVGVGGSATTDGGAGMIAALGVPLLLGGGALAGLESLDLSGLDPRLRRCRIDVAVDVRSPLLGPTGAAAVFAPQKGATPAQVAVLERGLTRWASLIDPGRAAEPGIGAAGGCAYALATLCGARILPGAALVCDLVGLSAALDGADLALTGEGCLDSSTAAGKAPAEVARRARAAHVPCVALAGAVESPVDSLYAQAIAISEGLALDEARPRTAELLRAATAALLRGGR